MNTGGIYFNGNVELPGKFATANDAEILEEIRKQIAVQMYTGEADWSLIGEVKRNPRMHIPIIGNGDITSGADALRGFEEYGVRAMVLPPVTFGAQNPGQRELAFCVHARYETQRAILTDIVASLHHQGLRKLLIINGHGGNSFKNMIRDLTIDFPDFTIATSEWFKMASARDFFENPGDHADELETSVMMYYHPELVDISEAGGG